MSEIEAIQAVSNALESLGDDEKVRVLAWAHAKYGNQQRLAGDPKGNDASARAAFNTHPPQRPNQGPIRKTKLSKKSKTIISMDKTLNLTPAGKPSAADFADSKAPSNAKEKCVVAVYYLRETLDVQKVSVQAVLTFFKTLHWPVPADLRNMLQQAGTEGWLDTASGDDIRLTSGGENLVEHKLKPKPKKF